MTPNALATLRDKLIADQPLAQQERMATEFAQLTRDVTQSLDVLNRDRFLQRLSAFRLAVREFAIS